MGGGRGENEDEEKDGVEWRGWEVVGIAGGHGEAGSMGANNI